MDINEVNLFDKFRYRELLDLTYLSHFELRNIPQPVCFVTAFGLKASIKI